MKRHHLIILLLVGIAGITCKKDNENWSQKLQGTAWAGEFFYNSPPNTPQAFTIVFGSDSNLLWYQSYTEFHGTWSVDKDIITIKITDNTFTAKLDKKRWSNFTVTTTLYTVSNVEKSFVPSANIISTEWTGKKNTKDITIKFKPSDKLEYADAGNTLTPLTLTYFVKGAGILFSCPSSSSIYGVSYYGAFYNDGKVFKGYAMDPYGLNTGPWSTTKK